jgi:methylenetetrahydrofolate dehydrogenase (NADP+)/methenyltetrahydrofolate cyclohydrolase
VAVVNEARRLDGKATAREIRAEIAEETARLKEQTGVVPGLTVVLVGDDAASQVYVRNKERAAVRAGMASRILRLSSDTAPEAILGTVRALNDDDSVHGILVQLPLPAGVNTRPIIDAIDPDKDVDGFHPLNAGRLVVGLPGFVPCTPAGIMELLRRNGIELTGKRAVVIGRSNIVGKPMAALLLREHCTVTICHSRTPDLAAVAAQADILVAAVGKPALITAEFIKPGAAVVDVGIHSVSDEATVRRLFGDDPDRLRSLGEKGSTLVGDVHPLEVRARAGWLTPVPGGVGPLTIAMLLRSTLRAARRAAGLETDD